MSEFSIIQEDNFIRVDITDGDQFAWIAEDTYINAFGDGNAVKIGANGTDLIELDFTKSILPAVTSGTIREDYVNDVLDLINIVNNKPIAIFGGITSAGTLDVSLVGGVIGVTSAGDFDVFITGFRTGLGITGTVSVDNFPSSLTDGVIGVTSAAPLEIFGGVTGGPFVVNGIVGVTGSSGGGTIDGIVGVTGGPITVDGIVGITGSAAGPTVILNASIGATESVSLTRIANEFDLDLSDGLLGGKICFNFLAFSDMIDTDTDDLNESSSSDDNGGGDVGDGFNFFETADTVDVISNSANDDGTGSRARTVTIEGLNGSFNEQTETVTLVGNGTVTSSNTYIRINKAFVASSGTYHETNQRDISLRRNTGGLKYTTIKKKIGRSRTGVYTVPTGKTAFITDIHITSNSQRRFSLKLYKLEGADDVTVPVNSPEVIYQTAHIEDANSMVCYIKVPEKSDIWATGRHDFGSGKVSIVIKIILVDN